MLSARRYRSTSEVLSRTLNCLSLVDVTAVCNSLGGRLVVLREHRFCRQGDCRVVMDDRSCRLPSPQASITLRAESPSATDCD